MLVSVGIKKACMTKAYPQGCCGLDKSLSYSHVYLFTKDLLNSKYLAMVGTWDTEISKIGFLSSGAHI